MRLVKSKYSPSQDTRYQENDTATSDRDSIMFSKQSLPLPLFQNSITIVLAFPLRRVCRVEQIVHITRHTAPTSWWRSINSLKREPGARQLPARIVAVCVSAAASKTGSETRSATAAGGGFV